jgi:hypothetical protein
MARRAWGLVQSSGPFFTHTSMGGNILKKDYDYRVSDSPCSNKMKETDSTVIWSDFYNPHLNGCIFDTAPDVDYSKLGPFEFDRKEFWAAVEELKKNADIE